MASAADAVSLSGIRPSIENVVATANLNCRLNLQQISAKTKNSEYNPKRFSAVVIRIKEPRATALVFATGRMVVMGAKSVENAGIAVRKFTKIVRKAGFEVDNIDFQLHNVVGCADVKFQIDLNALFCEHNKYSSFDPESFPGLTYRMMIPDVVILIFSSGKVVLTKAKDPAHVNEAFEKIYPILEMFRRKE